MNKRMLLLLPTSCLNKAKDDEPVFLLKASDPLAAQTIRHWASMATFFHSEEKSEDALKVADEFDTWHLNHFDSGIKKLMPRRTKAKKKNASKARK